MLSAQLNEHEVLCAPTENAPPADCHHAQDAREERVVLLHRQRVEVLEGGGGYIAHRLHQPGLCWLRKDQRLIA